MPRKSPKKLKNTNFDKKGRRKMYRTYDIYEGEPIMLYRSAESVKNDIRKISDKIKEAEQMLDIRSLLMDMLTKCAEEDPERWLPDIEDVVRDAANTLEQLRSLKESLEELFDEWREIKCAQ